MKNEIHERKKRIAYEVMIVVGVLVLILMVMSIWPLVLLLIPVIIICALRLLFLKLRTVEVIVPVPPAEPPPPETEISIIQRAFGLVQRRITEQLALQHPGARWVWSASNAIERFKNNEPLVVLLNSAGGYNKAQVVVHNMLFKGLYFITLDTANPPASIPDGMPETEAINDLDENDDHEMPDDIRDDDEPVNYGRLAFEWVDINMVEINARYNEAIAQTEKEMLIPAATLPHPDSWPDVCEELKRNGFSVADFCEDGIKVNITGRP